MGNFREWLEKQYSDDRLARRYGANPYLTTNVEGWQVIYCDSSAWSKMAVSGIPKSKIMEKIQKSMRNDIPKITKILKAVDKMGINVKVPILIDLATNSEYVDPDPYFHNSNVAGSYGQGQISIYQNSLHRHLLVHEISSCCLA